MKMKNGDIIEYKDYVIIKTHKCSFYIIKDKEIVGYGNSVKNIKKMIDKNEKV